MELYWWNDYRFEMLFVVEDDVKYILKFGKPYWSPVPNFKVFESF